MRSSVEVSSSCKRRKFWFALRSGYASASAKSWRQRAGEHVLGLGLLLRPGLLRLRSPRCGPRPPPRACWRLVRGVALHRLDQVRDEVVPALELHVDLRPRGVDPVPEPDEAVVAQRRTRARSSTTITMTMIATTTCDAPVGRPAGLRPRSVYGAARCAKWARRRAIPCPTASRSRSCSAGEALASTARP